MKIRFTKISDTEHQVAVVRADGSQDTKVLNSRSFLFHDFAHLALETAMRLEHGFWGSVATGASLSGSDCKGNDILLAESLAGPIQVLIKKDAEPADYRKVLSRLLKNSPQTKTLSESIHAEARHLKGLWRATPYGKTMEVDWTLTHIEPVL